MITTLRMFLRGCRKINFAIGNAARINEKALQKFDPPYQEYIRRRAENAKRQLGDLREFKHSARLLCLGLVYIPPYDCREDEKNKGLRSNIKYWIGGLGKIVVN